jgi:transcriptional regulator with XRE-family HTH domain
MIDKNGLDWSQPPGAIIRQARNLQKPPLSQKILAKKAGIAQSTLSQIERGIGFPKEDTLKAITNILKIPYSPLQNDFEYAQIQYIHKKRLWRHKNQYYSSFLKTMSVVKAKEEISKEPMSKEAENRQAYDDFQTIMAHPEYRETFVSILSCLRSFLDSVDPKTENI